ncbi:hypothetical protein KKF81_00420 [Candidatus Micrarchaeota archaeon]|nr:hypothetical protein [Candidatus Micrarchaeota archaeon]MBU1165382.1 hypothetical protein [Candidatus Micrarchaeota archaeon]MBU1886219.1 hypothetical protein [Candidatus Micrarchaeota archaeon]
MEKNGYKKGQAVMEYLITYGLALFVILIVLAILVAVILPSLKAPETCQFSQPGFSCNKKTHALISDSGTDVVSVAFQLDNQQGKGVQVTGILCTDVASGNIDKESVHSFGAEHALPPAEEHLVLPASLVSGQNIEMVIYCVDDNGVPLHLATGTDFTGTVAVTYHFENEVSSAPERLALATVSGTLQGSD